MILNLPVAPQDISRASVDSKLRRTQVCITPDFNRCRMTMNKARSTREEWDLVLRGREISVGKCNSFATAKSRSHGRALR